MKRIVPPLLIAVGLLVVVAAGVPAAGGAGDPVLEVTVEDDDTVAVTLTEVPESGLSGFEFEFAARDGATIERIQFTDAFDGVSSFDISADGTSARAKASDGSNTITGSDGAVTLLRMQLSGVSTDEPPISMTVLELQNENGAQIDAPVQIGEQSSGGAIDTTATPTTTTATITTATPTTTTATTTDETEGDSGSTTTADAVEPTDSGESTAEQTTAATAGTTDDASETTDQGGRAEPTPAAGPGFDAAIALSALAAAGLVAGRIRRY